MFKKILAAICCSAALTSAALAYDPAQTSILVGTSCTYPPYEFVDTEGKPAGFDIDLMNALGEKMGKEIEWFDTGRFDALLASVSAGKVDCAIAGMSATPERAQRMLFSDIYEESHSAFLVATGTELQSLEELKGKVGAVQQGTVEETFLMAVADQYGFTLKIFPKFDDCVLDLLTDRTDFTLMDVPAAKEYLTLEKFNGKIKIAFSQSVTGAGKAIALPKGNEALMEELNAALAALEADGTVAALREKWNISMDVE